MASVLASVTVREISGTPWRRKQEATKVSKMRARPRLRNSGWTQSWVICPLCGLTLDASTRATSSRVARSWITCETCAEKAPQPEKRTMLLRKRIEPWTERYWSLTTLSGWRHQAQQAGHLQRGRTAGRELSQNAVGHGRRHPRYHRETGGPPAQHAHARVPERRAPGARGHRDHRNLRPHLAPPRHGQSARRVGRPRLPPSGSGSLRGDRPNHRIEAPLQRRIPERDPHHRRERVAPRRHSRARGRPPQAAVFHLSED